MENRLVTFINSFITKRTHNHGTSFDLKGNFLHRFGSSIKGVGVNERTAEGLSTYWRCVNLITGSISSLPIQLREKQGDQTVRVTNSMGLNALLNPNPNITRFTFYEILLGNALNHGNGYAIIEVTNGKIILWPIHPDFVQVFMSTDDEIFYQVSGNGSKNGIFSKEEMFHIRGYGTDILEGWSILERQRITLSQALAAQREQNNFYAKGVRLDGYISMPGELQDTTKIEFRQQWGELHGIDGTGGRTAVLDNDMKFFPLTMKPADAMFLEAQQFGSVEIANIFGVPLSKLNILDRSTHTNMEQQNIQYVQECLLFWTRRLELEAQSKLLTQSEKNKDRFYKWNLNGLLRGDIETRTQFYRQMIINGVMTQNEIRLLEDMNKKENDPQADNLHIPLQVISGEKADGFYDKISEVPPSNSNSDE